jgi:hypothetical protein
MTALTLAGVGVFLLWMKYKPKSDLGGPCTAAIDCVEGTEYCLHPTDSPQGVCTKSCDVDDECGAGLTCKPTDIVETIVDPDGDVSTHNWKMGYCFAE